MVNCRKCCSKGRKESASLATWKTVATWTTAGSVKWQTRKSVWGKLKSEEVQTVCGKRLFQVVFLWKGSKRCLTSGRSSKVKSLFFILSLRWEILEHVFMLMEVTWLREKMMMQEKGDKGHKGLKSVRDKARGIQATSKEVARDKRRVLLSC